MKGYIHLIAATIFATLQLVHTQNGPGGLLAVLRSNGLTNYATFLETRSPLTLAKLTGRTDIICFAVPNSVSADPPPAPRNTTTLAGRDAAGEGNAAGEMVDDTPPPPPKIKKRQQLPDSNFRKHRTFLKDPAFVNLGGDYLNLVTNYASPQTPGDNSSDTEIMTGLGNVVNATGDPIKFNEGVIYVVDAWFTLPALLTDTLVAGGAASFLSAIIRENLQTRLDYTPRITVFAPLSELGSNDTIEGQVVFDFVGYLPDFVPGQTYGSITITKVGGQYFANGNRIVKSDVPIKNGVAHFVENPPPTTTNGTSNVTGTPPPVPTGASTSLNAPLSMIFGALALGLGLWWAI